MKKLKKVLSILVAVLTIVGTLNLGALSEFVNASETVTLNVAVWSCAGSSNGTLIRQTLFEKEVAKDTAIALSDLISLEQYEAGGVNGSSFNHWVYLEDNGGAGSVRIFNTEAADNVENKIPFASDCKVNIVAVPGSFNYDWSVRYADGRFAETLNSSVSRITINCTDTWNDVKNNLLAKVTDSSPDYGHIGYTFKYMDVFSDSTSFADFELNLFDFIGINSIGDFHLYETASNYLVLTNISYITNEPASKVVAERKIYANGTSYSDIYDEIAIPDDAAAGIKKKSLPSDYSSKSVDYEHREVFVETEQDTLRIVNVYLFSSNGVVYGNFTFYMDKEATNTAELRIAATEAALKNWVKTQSEFAGYEYDRVEMYMTLGLEEYMSEDHDSYSPGWILYLKEIPNASVAESEPEPEITETVKEEPSPEIVKAIKVEEEKIENVKEVSNAVASISEGGEAVISAENGNVSISNDIFTKAAEKDASITLDCGTYSWSFSDLDGTTAELKSARIVTNAYIPAINDSIAGTEAVGNTWAISFEHSGDLPGKAIVTLDTEARYTAGTVLHFYYYNKELNKFEYLSDSEVGADGKVKVRVYHCSDYIFTAKALPNDLVVGGATANASASQNTAPSTGKDVDFTAYIILMAAVVTMGCAVILRKKERA